MDIVAMTVSTNYEDYLQLCLQENFTFFKKWYIITEQTDTATQELCKKYSNVETLYFKFQTGSKIFNKGGAIRMAQNIAHEKFSNHLFLIMDSDICLPKDVISCIENIEDNCIYGADRLMIPTINDYVCGDHSTFRRSTWQNTKKPNDPNWWNVPWGYFQLYKTPLLYKDSHDAGKTDAHFSHCFLKKQNLPLIVKHVGPTASNWKGRVTPKESDTLL